ncbi:hypothetical protein ABBQ38_001260 [Trebouxia sp. C0009 RCD-2024]
MTQPVSGLRAGVNAASKSPQSTVAKSDCNTGLHDGMADPEVYKHVEISKQLATLLEVASADQVLAQAEKVVARLKRLDEVMPNYQHVASQLYDLLRVRSLDDVVPAVKALVL